ncbi:hypothetical protein ALC57_09930, partial [Trachymyrmex cornetzi]
HPDDRKYLRFQSQNQLFQFTALLFGLCADRDLFLYTAYIPSTQNVPDAHSRIISDETEWSLNQIYFNKSEENFGPFDIDLFASINAKYVCLASWVSDPETLAVEIFSLDPHENLSLVLMSRRLTTLFALSTAQRMQTLIGKNQPLLILKNAIIIIDKQRYCTVIDFLIDDIQIIIRFPDLYCVNDNVNVKNDKDVILKYHKGMIQQYLPYWE